MENIKCPVCGKEGIEDYHSKDIICPCCGSDLSIFRVIDKIPNKSSNAIIWKILTCIILVISFIIGLFLYNKNDNLKNAESSIVQMQDSISVLNKDIQLLKEEIVNKQEKEIFYKHIVKPGDNLWDISCRYYYTGVRYKDIAEWNNIDVNSIILVGDTLIIK